MSPPPSTRPSLAARLGLAAAAAAGTLLLLEAGLRLAYAELPSLAPLAGVESAPAGSLAEDEVGRETCRQPPGGEILHSSWSLEIPGQGEALHLWAAGDSITMGAGVRQEQTYAADLARRLAESTGRPVHLLDVGIQGAAYCNTVQDLHLYLDRACPGEDCPDALVLQLFADDLEQRTMYEVQGQVIAFPWREPNPLLRPVVSRSYLANLVWSQLRARRGSATPDRGILEADQRRFRGSLRALADRLDALDVAWVITLVPPAGLPWCDDADFAARVTDCAWMAQDMDLMAVMLVQEGLPWVDLRSTWHGLPDVTLDEERQELARRGRLPVHPSAAGHAHLGEALWPALQQALQARP